MRPIEIERGAKLDPDSGWRLCFELSFEVDFNDHGCNEVFLVASREVTGSHLDPESQLGWRFEAHAEKSGHVGRDGRAESVWLTVPMRKASMSSYVSMCMRRRQDGFLLFSPYYTISLTR